MLYLTIRLRARDFYSPESIIPSRANNLIVLAESEMKHKILRKNTEKRELENDVLLLAIYLTVILRTRVVYELIADEVRSTELAIKHIRRE